jgi:hypothetical protein
MEILSDERILLADLCMSKISATCSWHVKHCFAALCLIVSLYSVENVGLQKEQKCNTFACHTCNEVRLCVLGIREKEVGNTKR